MPRQYLLPVAVASIAMQAWASDSSVPLFVIERSTNVNVIRYEAQITQDGHLNPRQPVIAYWIMSAEDGRRQQLNLLERTKAYGFAIRPDGSNDSCLMTLVSDRRREIRVYLRDGKVCAETTIRGRRALLQKIFVTTRKSWMRNEPVSAELYGVDVLTGESRYEKIAQDR